MERAPSLRAAAAALAAWVLSVGAQAAVPSAGDLLRAPPWRAVGPAATGGRIVDIDVDRRRPWTLFVAAATGGLWKSVNHGTTWTCIFQHEGVISIGDIAVDPNNADVIWVGSGEANNQRSSYWGDGVYKTVDGGKRWVNTGLTDSHHVARIVIDPRDSDVVWVAAMGHLYTRNDQRGLYCTRDGGRTWQRRLFVSDAVGVTDVVLHPRDPDVVFAATYERLRRPWHFDEAGPGSGVWRSKDGGETWQRLAGGLPDGEIGRIGLDVCAARPDVIYACVENVNEAPPEPDPETGADAAPGGAADGGEPARFGARGENADDGVRITAVIEGEAAARAGIQAGDVILAVDERLVLRLADLVVAVRAQTSGDTVSVRIRRGDEERTVQVTFGTPPAPPAPRGPIGGEVYRSDDAGTTWRKVNERPVGGEPGYYYGQIRVDPRDPDRLFILGIPLFRSDDGGKTFARDEAASLHVDHHALWIDPDDPVRIVLGNDGGLAVSWDGGRNWDHVNNLPLGQFYTVAVDHEEPYRVYGGTQDNGTWMGPSRARSGRGVSHLEWTQIGGGDGFHVQPDLEDGRYVLLESQFGGIERLDLHTWERTSIRPRVAEGEPRDRFNWSSPILRSAHNPRIVYFGAQRLYRSLDLGDTWFAVSGDLSSADPDKIAGNVPHCTITTVAESRFDPDRLLVGTDDGRVHWSEDGGDTWIDCSARFPGLPGPWWVSRVEFSPHQRDVAYVAFTGYREDDFAPYLFRTEDAGANWQSIAGNLPPGPVNVVREDPLRAGLLYVGTEFGVYATLDGGERWSELGSGLPTVPVHDLVIHPRDRDCVIGTHGRGFFVVDVSAVQQITPELLAADAALLEVEDVVRYRRAGGGSEGAAGDRLFRAEEPPRGPSLWIYLREPRTADEVALEVLDGTEQVVRTLQAPGDPGLHRVTWDLRRQPEDGEGQGRRRRGGATVGEGTYTARLTVAGQEHRRTFRVLPDPQGGAPADP